MAKKALKPFPGFASDEEAERFLAEADLSQYDLLSGGLPADEWLARLDTMYKDARVNLRLPRATIEAYKQKAKERRMPYQRLMRITLQAALRRAG